MRTKHILTSLLLAICLPATAMAAGKYYWVDSDGHVVRDGFGDCVIALYHGASFPECDGAEPAPVAAPAPVVVAPVVTPAPVAAPMDSDGDGISDAMDNCPNTMVNTPVNAQGCMLDRDRDGVANNRDQCPGTPGGATVDSRGCAQKIVVQNLNFPSNSSVLNAESKQELDKVASSIIANPSVKQITVTGYSDDRGAADYNKSLSERRAKSVADYLVSKGLAADKVSSSGMGEANPIASNATAAGRRDNRRVEIDLK